MNNVDPITFAVVRQKLVSIANGMQETGTRMGFTTFMYEVHDCLFAILDEEAGVVAESDGLFLASLSPAVRNCLDYIGRENIEEGDIIVCNLPTITGNHTCDAVLFTPIFFRGELFGYATTKAHWMDLGAKTSYPTNATNIFEEGLRLPPLKLYRKGELQEAVWDIIRNNSRAPQLVWGDMQAQLAGCYYGLRQMTEMLEKYGAATVRDIIREMYDYSERVTRLAIEKIPDGTWTAEDIIDSNGIDLETPVNIRVAVTVKGSDITVDLTGSDPQQPGPMNSLWVTTLSFVRMTLKALTSPELPLNEGFNRPIHLIAPEGCIFNASPSAPCFLCGNVSQNVRELVHKAMWKVLPQVIPACSGADVIGQGLFGADPETGRYWGTLTPCVVGTGANYKSDGEGYQGGGAPQNIPMEILEAEFPLLVEEVGFVTDSGGAGKYRGGPATRLKFRLTAPAVYYAFIEKNKSVHWGCDGGLPGLRNFAEVRPAGREPFEVLKNSGVGLAAGDRVEVTAGGGGGYGCPLERDPEKVRRDVVNGYVSAEAARREYGVVLDAAIGAVDAAATADLRVKMAVNQAK